MELRRLGNSGTIVTAWCLGTMTFGAESDEATSFALMDTYTKAGGNGVKYDSENTGYGFQTKALIPMAQTELPTTCTMKRPAM